MIGQILKGTYKLYDKVGSGGFATVYLGRNLRTNQIVAVKVLREEFAEDPGSVERFRREAQLVQRLDHPNIVRVLDFGVEAGQHFLVMDYIEGKTLAQIIRERGTLPVAEALNYAAQVCEALQVAHRAGVVHRDIKPQNLMVTPDGMLKVMDFGVAKLAAMTVLTHSGQSLGTPLYMAPEIANGLPADIRSDIYSLGIVLYQMLAGKVPFEGDSPWTVMRQQIETPPRPLSALRRDLPARVELIVIKALAKDPAARYQTPVEMLMALRGFTDVSPVGARMSVSPQAERQQGRSSAATQLVGRPQGVKTQTDRGRLRVLPWALGGAVALLALIVVLLFQLYNSNQKERPKDLSLAEPTSTSISVAQGDDPTTAPAVTRLVPTFTPTPTVVWTHTPSPEPSTPTAILTDTLLPKATFSPTPSSPRVIATNNSINVRSGPGTQYPVVGRLQQGESHEITGRNQDATWWGFVSDERLVWVSGSVVDVAGNLKIIPVAAIPPTPSPTAAPVQQYLPLSLRTVTNSGMQEGYVQPPLGKVTLAGIPFDLADGQSVTTQAAPLPNNPTQVVIPVNATGPRAVYLLITGGDLYSRYSGKPIGQVRLTFVDGRSHLVDLVAGLNIREWKQGEGTIKTTSSPDVTGVWSGANKFDGSTAIIDMLQVTVPKAFQSNRLTRIEILDTSQQTIGEFDPAINLLGVTVLSEY